MTGHRCRGSAIYWPRLALALTRLAAVAALTLGPAAAFYFAGTVTQARGVVGAVVPGTALLFWGLRAFVRWLPWVLGGRRPEAR